VKEFDIDLKKFDFKSDLAYGEQGEALVMSFIESLRDSQIEVKTDRYRNGKMVVETQQSPGGIKDKHGLYAWKPSGINVTTAKWWVYIYGLEGGAFVAVPVERLKRYLKAKKSVFCETKKVIFAENSDNPSKGFLLMPHHVMEMLYDKRYDYISLPESKDS
jgi:hypothetical protein